LSCSREIEDLAQIIGNLIVDNPVYVPVVGQIEKGLLEIVEGLGEISDIFASNLKKCSEKPIKP
jgi:hypothetical protein